MRVLPLTLTLLCAAGAAWLWAAGARDGAPGEASPTDVAAAPRPFVPTRAAAHLAHGDASAGADASRPAHAGPMASMPAASQAPPDAGFARPRGWPWSPTPSAAGGHRRSATAGGQPAGEPAVPERVAFRALWYLGVDPAAEATWQRAINDPNLPAETRSDLIVDMTDEGYTDNDRPTLADLPLIRARLAILERHAPAAMDDVNRRAFEAAYRGLLATYERLVAEAAAARNPSAGGAR